jgi:hypothetical protein
MVFGLNYLAEACWMILVQVFLLKIQHIYQTNPRNRPLTSFEKCIIGIAFWTVFVVGKFGTRIIINLSTSLFISTGREKGTNTDNIEQHGRSSTAGELVYKVLATWLIHKAVNFILETALPFWDEMAGDSDKARRKLEARASELLDSIQDLIRGQRLGHKRVHVMHRSGQEISLDRRQINNPMEGQRTLDWNIVVEKTALDEMKETLGPPGGFGEMGFNVSKDGVCFEAMGVGTRFNLKFSSEPSCIPPVEPRKKRRPQVKGRSNTK